MTDFAATKAQFDLPPDIVYLDGNSLGPLPRTVVARLERTVSDEWRNHLITGWNKADWMGLPRKLGDRIATLIGAGPGQIVVGDTLSIKVYQAIAAALDINKDRRTILSDTGNFPSDLYMAQGLVRILGPKYSLKTVAPKDIAGALTDDVGVLMLTEVDYRTGRLHDMAALTQQARSKGIVTVWDLAHSAGALPVEVAACGADFAVGCTYKYLNSGPGGPAFIYVAPRHSDQVLPALSGWLGHDDPFAFEPTYRPGAGIDRMRVGTPAILQMAALDGALDVWDGVNLGDVRARSIELSESLIKGVETHAPQLVLNSPRDPDQRGSQVSFRFEQGYAVMQALIERGVIGDFRAPDNIRFGITPLYLDQNDIDRGVQIISDVMNDRLWDDPRYKIRAAVT